MLTVNHEEKIAILTFKHGPASALDLEFCQAINKALSEIRASEARALVITGSGSVFSAGVDLNRMLQGRAEYISEFLPEFGQVLETLLFFPKPVVAAVNGHAIAGGGLMACAADARLMAAGTGRIGVPELRVGVAFPPLAMELMRSRLNPLATTDVLLSGKLCTPEDAEAYGMIHKVVNKDELLSVAISKSQKLAEVQPELYALTKEQLNQPIREAIDAGQARWGDQIMTQWQSDQAMESLAAYIKMMFGKK